MIRMFSFDEVVVAVNGTVINRKGYTGDSSSVTGVSTDTRTIETGNIYIALKGESFDGHKFTQEAVNKGACAVIVDKASAVPEGAVGIVVKDTLVALGDIARHYRFKLKAKVIAVTGSVGKTTTRELIKTAIEPSKKVVATSANLNNEIGLPKTILSAPRETEVLVLEMGMRGRGQISYLTNIACPDVAVITNAGYSHIGILGSREEIRAAKSEIIEGLTDNGTLIVNGDDAFLFDYIRNIIPLNNGLIAVSSEGTLRGKVTNCPVVLSASNIRENNGTDFDVSLYLGDEVVATRPVHISLSGEHNVRNAGFALCCAQLVGADIDKAGKALAEYTPMDGRGRTFYGKKYTIINDAYNASPESMTAAFANLKLVNPGSRKVAVLGGMGELGDLAPKLHEETGKKCGEYDFDLVIVTGDDKDSFVKGLKESSSKTRIIECDDTDQVKAAAQNNIKEGDTVLFKASHVYGFEKLAQEFIDNDED